MKGVAHVFQGEGGTGSPQALAEQKDNMALICAAPDLLAALDGMLERFQDHEQYADGGDEGVWLTDAQAIASAREAIAKATGGGA